MKKHITFLIFAVMITYIGINNLQAQNTVNIHTVSGIITNNMGEPLPGVSILIKDANTWVISNLDGEYSIQVAENATLVFMYIGHVQQEIAVNSQDTIHVIMEDIFSQGLQMAEPIELTTRQRKRMEADNNFALKMFKEVSQQEGDNVFFSPLSLNMAVGMLYNGASGDTQKEIAEAFEIHDFSITESNEYYREILHKILEIDPTSDIAIANSIWYKNSFSVKEQFIGVGKKYFDADINAIDFNNPVSAKIINNWCAKKTNNRIENIIGKTIPNDMRIYLVNALYFKGQWQTDIKFDKAKTTLDKFTKTNKQKIKVNLMEKTTYLNYFSDENLQCVEIDYGNRAFSMLVILPSKNQNINQFIHYLDGEKLNKVVKNMRWTNVWLKLPRFKIENDFSLAQPIRNLGIERIFDKGFLNISDDDLWVSDIIQKTFVEVNEEGTEAAAATSIIMIGAGSPHKKIEPIRFFANRPFVYLIREKSTGIVLFIGRMDEPIE